MQDLEFSNFDIRQLYGEKLYALGGEDEKIEWKVKPASKIFFVLSKTEFYNKSLTELLRKIIVSLEIPTEQVGFGLVNGSPAISEFFSFPGKFGVTFGRQYIPDVEYKKESEGRNVFFAATLEELSGSQSLKTELWNHLKSIKGNLA